MSKLSERGHCVNSVLSLNGTKMNMFKSNFLFSIVTIFILGSFTLQACYSVSPNNGEVDNVNNAAAVKVIYETDFTFDVDDVGALAILHAMADNGEVEILAVSYNESQNKAADAIDAVNTWYGRGDIPIGLYDKPLASPDFYNSPYINTLAGMANDITDNTVDSSLNVYQQVLAQQPDHSVTIISVGFLNNLYDLLKEDLELVASKVNKLVLMGGVYYDDFNFVRHDLVDQTQYVIENWPTPVIVSQEGEYIKTGAALEETPIDNPVREAYYKWFDNSFQDRSSWDQVAVLYAVRGTDEYFEEVSEGTGQLDNGYQWNMQPEHRMYLTHKLPTSQMAEIIESLMVQAPQASSH